MLAAKSQTVCKSAKAGVCVWGAADRVEIEQNVHKICSANLTPQVPEQNAGQDEHSVKCYS